MQRGEKGGCGALGEQNTCYDGDGGSNLLSESRPFLFRSHLFASPFFAFPSQFGNEPTSFCVGSVYFPSICSTFENRGDSYQTRRPRCHMFMSEKGKTEPLQTWIRHPFRNMPPKMTQTNTDHYLQHEGSVEEEEECLIWRFV